MRSLRRTVSAARACGPLPLALHASSDRASHRETLTRVISESRKLRFVSSSGGVPVCTPRDTLVLPRVSARPPEDVCNECLVMPRLSEGRTLTVAVRLQAPCPRQDPHSSSWCLPSAPALSGTGRMWVQVRARGRTAARRKTCPVCVGCCVVCGGFRRKRGSTTCAATTSPPARSEKSFTAKFPE